MKKILLIPLLVFNALAFWYLITPTPTITDLTNSVKSDLSDDNFDPTHVSGYFANLSRTEVINFYKANINGLFRIQLNHPPEKSRDIFYYFTKSTYLEEFVFPFKQSLYINGYEWENDVFTKPENRITNKLTYQNKTYQTKINIKAYTTTIPQRLIAFFTTQIAVILIAHIYLRLFLPKKRE